jgi:hypothetical protein
LNYVANTLPQIPVPRVIAFDAASPGSSAGFVAEEYVEGQPLSKVWSGYTDEEKHLLARKIAGSTLTSEKNDSTELAVLRRIWTRNDG